MKQVIIDIVKQVIIALGVTIILAIAALLPITKPYFLDLLSLLQKYLVQVGLLILFLLFVYLLLKVRILSNLLSSLTKKVHSSPQTQSLVTGSDKKLDLFSNELINLKKVVSAASDKIHALVSDVYEIKRDYLFRKARIHEDKGQRGSLLCRLQVLEMDIQKESEYNLEESLQELFSYVKKESIFSIQDLSDTKNCLQKIKNEGQKEIVDQIMNHVKSKVG